MENNLTCETYGHDFEIVDLGKPVTLKCTVCNLEYQPELVPSNATPNYMVETFPNTYAGRTAERELWRELRYDR